MRLDDTRVHGRRITQPDTPKMVHNANANAFAYHARDLVDQWMLTTLSNVARVPDRVLSGRDAVQGTVVHCGRQHHPGQRARRDR